MDANRIEIRQRKKMVVAFIVTGLFMTLVLAFAYFTHNLIMKYRQ